MTDDTRGSRLKTLTPQDVKEATIVDLEVAAAQAVEDERKARKQRRG